MAFQVVKNGKLVTIPGDVKEAGAAAVDAFVAKAKLADCPPVPRRIQEGIDRAKARVADAKKAADDDAQKGGA